MKRQEKILMGAYIRVANKGTTPEDSAIKLQKEIINKYVKEQMNNNYSIEYYIDNGYSGATFNRPEFKRMLKDIEENKINTIIIKDITRFGRFNNALDIITKLNQKYNTNFISIADKLDTINNKENFKVFLEVQKIMKEQFRQSIKVGRNLAKER